MTFPKSQTMEDISKILFLLSASITVLGQHLNCYTHKTRKCFLIEKPKEALKCFKATYSQTQCEQGQTLCLTQTIVANDDTVIHLGKCDVEEGLRDKNDSWRQECIYDLKKDFAHIGIKEANCAICKENLCNTKVQNDAFNIHKFSFFTILFLLKLILL